MSNYHWYLISTDANGHETVSQPMGLPTSSSAFGGTAQEYAEAVLRQRVDLRKYDQPPLPVKMQVRVWEGEPAKDAVPDAEANWP